MRSDDEKLVSQTLSGDRDAFGVLVHKYQEMVYAYAFQKVRNEEDAQDITQEVFLAGISRSLSTPAPTSVPKLALYDHVQRVQTPTGERYQNTSTRNRVRGRHGRCPTNRTGAHHTHRGLAGRFRVGTL